MKRLPGKYAVPAIHFVIWFSLLAIPTILFHGEEENIMGLSHFFFVAASIYHIGLFYLNAYFLYPRLLTKKRWWLYIPSIAAILIVSYYAKVFFLRLDPSFQLTDTNSRVIFFGLIPFIVASILFRLISDRIRFERLEKEARAERLAAELKFFRSQVSPHFLFNMMANMVALARQHSAMLEPSLIRLSDLLRYMLYDSNEKEISLAKEIEHLENYISLQQLRFGEDVRAEVSINNESPDYQIEPMLLVPFIENAYKHGMGMVENPFIKIQLTAKNGILNFNVSNNYKKDNGSKDKNSGIGLENVKNRLNMLYPGKYRLNINDENELFVVDLNLDLS